MPTYLRDSVQRHLSIVVFLDQGFYPGTPMILMVNKLDSHQTYLTTKVIVLSVEKSDKSGVDRTFLWHFYGTVREYPQDFGSESRQVRFQNTC